jgi:hypothetical protein
MKHPGPGVRGWIAAGVVVVLAEALDSRTMSSAWKATPAWVTAPIAAYTLAHLYGKLPESVDLFAWATRLPVTGAARRDTLDHK